MDEILNTLLSEKSSFPDKELIQSMKKALNYLGFKYTNKEIESKITGGGFGGKSTMFSLGIYKGDNQMSRLGFNIHVQFSIDVNKQTWVVGLSDSKMKFKQKLEFKNGKWNIK